MTGGSGGLGQIVPRGNVTMSPCQDTEVQRGEADILQQLST